MPRCAVCGRRFLGEQEACPACAPPLRSRPAACPDDHSGFAAFPPGTEDGSFSGPMVPIARFGNAAEAGFFAHELQWRQDLPVELTAEEDYDALSGCWTTRYLLLVPEADGPSAALLLKSLVEQSEGDPPPAEEAPGALPGGRSVLDDLARHLRSDADPRHPIHWVPIVLTLAAGSAALWGIRKFPERPKVNLPAAPVGRQHLELWEALAAPAGPWTLHRDGLEGTRQLLIDAARGVAVIREDANGDGVFERELRLRPEPAER